MITSWFGNLTIPYRLLGINSLNLILPQRWMCWKRWRKGGYLKVLLY